MKRICFLALLLPFAAFADEADYTLVIKDHHFQPEELAVPAGKKIRLQIDNQDGTPEEFESHELNREKVVGAHAKAMLYIGPMDAGRYPFIGEFNEVTAHGVIVAK